MQVTETVNEGLKRELKIVVNKNDMGVRVTEKLEQMRPQMRLNGFRQGKVPLSHLRSIYGKQAMAEIVDEYVSKRTGDLLKERKEKAAQQPEISMTEDKAEAEEILAGKRDFEFSMSYEVIPEFNTPELGELKLVRPVAPVSDDAVEERIKQIGENLVPYQEKIGKAATKDRVTLNYVGKIDGEPFEEGADNDAKLVLGSNTFIPGFEEQLEGLGAGDNATLKVNFPDDYDAEHLAGKEAEFDVLVSLVEEPGELEINDEFATRLGMESIEKLREAVRKQIEGQYISFSKAKLKRQIMDQLDEKVGMELPEKMVDQEFSNIMQQITSELKNAGKTFEDEHTSEEKAKEEFRTLAQRRVRLGLVLANIGEDANIEITEEEMQKAIYQQVQQFPGQQEQVLNFFRENPDAVAGLRAPIFEEKVVDFIIEKAEVEEKSVSVDELMKDDDEEAEKPTSS